MLVLGHVHPRAAEAHAFHFEPRALLQGGFAFQLDLSSRSDHALLRQASPALAQ